MKKYTLRMKMQNLPLVAGVNGKNQRHHSNQHHQNDGAISNVIRVKLNSHTSFRTGEQTVSTGKSINKSTIDLNVCSTNLSNKDIKTLPIQGSTNNVDRPQLEHSSPKNHSVVSMNQVSTSLIYTAMEHKQDATQNQLIIPNSSSFKMVPLSDDNLTPPPISSSSNSFSTSKQSLNNHKPSQSSDSDLRKPYTIEKKNISEKQRRKRCLSLSPVGFFTLALLLALFVTAAVVIPMILIAFKPTNTSTTVQPALFTLNTSASTTNISITLSSTSIPTSTSSTLITTSSTTTGITTTTSSSTSSTTTTTSSTTTGITTTTSSSTSSTTTTTSSTTTGITTTTSSSTSSTTTTTSSTTTSITTITSSSTSSTTTTTSTISTTSSSTSSSTSTTTRSTSTTSSSTSTTTRSTSTTSSSISSTITTTSSTTTTTSTISTTSSSTSTTSSSTSTTSSSTSTTTTTTTTSSSTSSTTTTTTTTTTTITTSSTTTTTDSTTTRTDSTTTTTDSTTTTTDSTTTTTDSTTTTTDSTTTTTDSITSTISTVSTSSSSTASTTSTKTTSTTTISTTGAASTITITSNICTSSLTNIAIVAHCSPCGTFAFYYPYTYNYTAVSNATRLAFAFRRQNTSYFALDSVSVRDFLAPSTEILVNGGFEMGNLSSWVYCDQNNMTSTGGVKSSFVYNSFTFTPQSGTYYYVGGGLISADYISQSFPSQIGHQYKVTMSIMYPGTGTSTSIDLFLGV